MSQQLKAHFTCIEGGSDKEYEIHLIAEGDGYVLHTYHGARGKSLKLTVKTKAPVAYEVAKKAYDKAYRERLAKHYKPSDSAGDMAAPACRELVATSMMPQLLNPIEECDVEQYLTSPDWIAQEKHDGDRRGFEMASGSVVSANRKGFSVAYPQSVVDAILQSCTQYLPLTVDGELIGTDYVIFDVRVYQGVNVEHLPLIERVALIHNLDTCLVLGGISNVKVVRTAVTTEAKRALLARMKEQRREGVVFKRVDAPYVPGKPNSGGTQLKFPFRKNATGIVISHHATKASVGIGMLDDLGNVIPVGNCTIPPNKSTPQVGALVDIQYLYAYQGGSLFQPVYLRERDDVSRDECTLSRLHYKSEAAFAEEADAA
ncbi:RNA ligase family protein [Pseudomonas aeruginosa]